MSGDLRMTRRSSTDGRGSAKIDDLRAGMTAWPRGCEAALGALMALVILSPGLVQCANDWSKLSRTNLLQFVEKGEVRTVRSANDWEKRCASVKEAMQEIMGRLPGPEKRCALDVRIEDEVDVGNYVRRFITYAAEPGERVPAYLLIPKSAFAGGSKVPGVLALHQTHALGQKVVVGLSTSTNDEYGVSLVKRGFVVLAPPYTLLANYQPDLKKLGYQSGTMKAIWNNIRALDLLQSLPYIRTNGFAAIGHSLGGHNSIFTAVFDERITVIVSSCGFDSFRDYMNGNIRGWTSERYMPRLLDYPLSDLPFDFYELAGCLAPRYFLVNAPNGDTNFKWQSVEAIHAEARKVYGLYKAAGRLQVEHPDCGHLFPQEMQQKAFTLMEEVLKEN